ncbi:hypothetical protein BHM03_00062288, partial [Ensete ventricosum]
GGRLQPRPPCKGAVGHLQEAADAVGGDHPQGNGAGRIGGRPLARRMPAAMRSPVACAGAAVAAVAQEGECEG